jgi:cyclase
VVFRGSNVVSAGEIFSTVGYPVIDLARGGSIQGEVRALNHLLEITVPEISQEGGTMVIPGHGRLSDEADVTEYRDMVTIVRDRVADLIAKGKSLDEAKAARLTRDYDGRYSQPSWTGAMFVESIYKSLKQSGSQGK